MGTPTYIIATSAAASDIENRFKEKNEIADDLPEEEKTSLAEKAVAAKDDLEKLKSRIGATTMSRVKCIDIDTGCSKESLIADVKSRFSAKVILVNHEKRISVDTACSNLAIKYNMLYMSVYQLIKNEISAETGLGRALVQSKREKSMDFGSAGAESEDPFSEATFSAVHYDQTLVMQLVQQKIAECRTSQRFILLEGLCNSNKLESDKQRL